MMKKLLAWALLAALILGLVAGCGTKSDVPPVTVAGTEEPQTASEKPAETGGAEKPSETAEPEKQEAVDLQALYAPVLDKVCLYLKNHSENSEATDVPSGLIEVAMWMSPDELLQSIGYQMKDLNADGTPELLIGQINEPGASMDGKTMLFGGYALVDGKPAQFLDGWGRNRYALMEDGRIFNSGSSGAAYSAFGSYHLSADGKELVCEDFYFTDDEGNALDPNSTGEMKLRFYHNQTGAWDKAVSEELKITDEAFWELSQKLEAQTVSPELIPFAAYAEEHPNISPYKVTAAFLEDTGLKAGEYEDELEKYPNIFQNAPYDTKVVFRAKERVKEFTVVSLELQDVDENGHANFKTEPLLSLYTLEADDPIAVPMSFPGDIPTNGISYLDENGEPLLFTVSISGMDGSLELLPVK